jgi:hypothetical protein
MRTITKMRLPAYGVIAIVLLTALSGIIWVMFAGVAIMTICSWWFGPTRCPRCGVIAGLVDTSRFWRPYISFRGICVKCGADFFKV